MNKVVKPGQTVLCPVPAVMVSCAAPGRQANIITLAWAGTVCSDPPTIALGIRPSRYSHGLIKDAGECVVNLPNKALLHATDYCGVVSGREVDKFARLGLTAVPGRHVKAPLIGECPINMEIRIVQITSLGSHDLFLGEVAAVHMDPGILNSRGSIDPAKFDPFAYGGGAYWGVADTLGVYGFSNGKP